MRLSAYLRVLGVCAVCLTGSACQYSPDISDRTMAYNHAVADTNNKLLLLNIVRASQRSPTYYSRLEGDTATASVTPNFSLALPLLKGSSKEIDSALGPAGATATGLKNVSTFGAITSALGFSASEGNVLNLQTLDDQKYQNGMMKPLTFEVMKTYFDEGYQRDLVMLLFVSKIGVQHKLVTLIDQAVHKTCEKDADNPICAYIRSDPYNGMFATSGWAADWSLAHCVESTAPDAKTETFSNDPARELLPPGSTAAVDRMDHPQVCFEILLQDLLALNLAIVPGGNRSYELVEKDIPADVVDTAKFRSEMITQKMRVFRDENTDTYDICKLKTSGIRFVLDLDRKKEASHTLEQDQLVKALSVSEQTPAPDQQKPAGKKGKRIQQTVSDNGADDDKDSQCGSIHVPQDDTAQGVVLHMNQIAFSIRSFEGMIYYLGEVTRAEEGGLPVPRSIVRILSRNADLLGPGHYNTMFYASDKLDSKDAAFTVRDEKGKDHSVPVLCPASVSLAPPRKDGAPCSTEYPDNESLSVMTLLNQVWGLQKEASTGPGAAIVVGTP